MSLFAARPLQNPFEEHYEATHRCRLTLEDAFPDMGALDAAYFFEWGENWDDYFGYLLDAGESEDEAILQTLERARLAYEGR